MGSRDLLYNTVYVANNMVHTSKFVKSVDVMLNVLNPPPANTHTATGDKEAFRGDWYLCVYTLTMGAVPWVFVS